MCCALAEAKKAGQSGEVPVGCVIVHENEIVASAGNSCIKDNSPLRHAEVNAIEIACKKAKNYRLTDHIMFVTLEPCHMCCMAIVHARIKKVYFSLIEPKSGAVVTNDNFFDHEHLNHKVEYEYGSHELDSKKLLQNFFINKRS